MDDYWVFTGGTVDAGTSTVIFDGADLSITTGIMAFNNVTVDFGGSANTITLTDTLDVDGNLTLTDVGDGFSGAGDIEVAGNLTSTDVGCCHSSNAITLDGANAQTVDIATGNLPSGLFTINKTSGTVTLLSAMNLATSGQDLTLTSGTLDQNGFDLAIDDVLTLESGTTLIQGCAALSYTTLTNNGGTIDSTCSTISWVAGEDTLLTSDDGITWADDGLPAAMATNTINDIEYGDGLWIAVGNGGKMMRSTDAVTWTATDVSAIFTTEVLFTIHYSDDKDLWMVISTARKTATSSDGITWNQKGDFDASGTIQTIQLTEGDGVWFANHYMSGSGSGKLRKSVDDGVSWSQVVAMEGSDTKGALYANGVSLAISASRTDNSRRSTDNWATSSTFTFPAGGGRLHNGIFGNGLFVETSAGGGVYSSADGSSWTWRVGPTDLYDVEFGDGLFVVDGFGAHFYTSTDTITWTSRIDATSGDAPTYGGPHNEPDAFTFTDQTGVATSTVINSNILTVTNFTGSLYVLAGATADVDVCVNDADSNLANGCSTTWKPGSTTTLASLAQVSAGDTVGIRMTSDGGGNTEKIATVQIGTRVTHWSVTTVAASSDSDGDLTASATITEPIALSSIADTVGERVAVFDFSIADGGTADALALAVSQVVLNTSGTGTFADITWQLDGPDASFVTGTVGGGTITFSSLSISVADGGSETYTVYAYFSTSPASTDGQTFILSVDGDTDLTVGGSGTQMGTTSAVNNSTGSTMDVVHSQLIFSTQPPASADTNTDFSGTIAVSATDVNNNVDIDFGENITVSAVITATHTAPGGTLTSTDSGGTTKSPTSGVATWTDTKYDVGETIDVKAVSATTYTAGIFSTPVAVTVPPDADGDLTASATVTEPIALSSIADTVGGRVAVFDFSIADGGTADALALAISQVVLNTSGTGTFADITWQLDGPDASFVTGTVGGGTITFSSLSISVADGASETYTVYAYFSTSPTSTDGQTFILSVDGDTDLTVGAGTQMGTTSAVNNSTGSTMDVVHSKLIFSTQPPASATTDTDFSGTIAVSATDVNNNVDIDFGETMTISAVITATHTAPGGTLTSTDSGGTTKTPTSGVATWTDTKYDVGETIDIKAVSATTYTTGIFSTSVTVAAISAAVTGTITPSATEAEIVSGGKTIFITLTGDTWVPGGSGFPQVESVTETSFAAEPTSHLVQMPAIVDPGDLLVILVSLHQEPPSATPGGWSQLFLLALGADEFAAYAKDAVGDEDGTTVDVTTTIGASGAAQVYRITNWEGTLVNGVEVGTAVGAQGTTPDPPSLTASWGAENNLWLAVAGAADDDQAATAYPTNYTNGIDTLSGGGANSSGQVYSARRENAIATENPAVFTLATTEAWVANTIVIRPAPSTFDSERQNIINGLDSAQGEGNGWDIVVAGGIPVGNVARTSDTVVTITLPALASYNITATETITAKVPATALVLSGSELTASPTFDVTVNPPTTLYRSVGTDNTDLNTGQTVQIVGTTATFSASMPNKIGVGDVLEYGSTNLAFISGRTSDTVYTVASSTGGTPVATGAGTPVSVFRAYTSLFNWEAQDENDAIDNTVENFDTSKDLVNDDTVMQVAAYADGPDTFASDVGITSAWVTGAINYIRIYTPVSSSEVGVSQRHTGIAGTGYVKRPTKNPGNNTELLEINTNYVRVEGIEFDGSNVTDAENFYGIYITVASGSTDIRIENSLIHDLTNSNVTPASSRHVKGIYVDGTSEDLVKIANTIIYAIANINTNSGSGTHGISLKHDPGASYVYNNIVFDISSPANTGTAHGMRLGGAASTTHYVKNNFVGQLTCTTCTYTPTAFRQGESAPINADNNVSFDGSADDYTGTGNVVNQTSYASYFVNVTAGSENFHLLADSNALWGVYGADVDTDPNLPVTTDIDGETRDSTNPDVGADEVLGVSAWITSTSPSSLTETNLDTATVTVVLSGGTYDASLVIGDFSLNGAPAGTTINSVVRDGDNQATLTLAFDATDFDTNASMSVTVETGGLVSGGPATTGTVTVTAVIEGDTTPDTFDFNNQAGVAVNTQTDSNIVQVNGMDNGTAISIDGGGSYTYRVCNDGTCSGAPSFISSGSTIDAGKYVQLRLTSSASNATAIVATLTVGTLGVDWSVTTGTAANDVAPASFSICSSPDLSGAVTYAAFGTVGDLGTDDTTYGGIDIQDFGTVNDPQEICTEFVYDVTSYGITGSQITSLSFEAELYMIGGTGRAPVNDPAEWVRLDEAFVQIYNNNTTSWENIGTSFIDSSVWTAVDNGDAATWDNVGEAHNGIGTATEDPLVRTKGSGWTDDYVNGSNEVRIRVTNKGKINGTTWDVAHVYDYARIDFTYAVLDVTVGTTGTQTSSIYIPSTDKDVGGAFVISENTGSRNVTGITISEKGTVDALNDLSNVRLYYETAADCSAVSFSGFPSPTESTFGSATTFDAVDGSASFSGSVAISTVSEMCVYVVLDVGSGATASETLEIEISDPSTEVSVDGGGSVGPGSAVELSGTTTLTTPPDLQQVHYRWRNDDGPEAGASLCDETKVFLGTSDTTYQVPDGCDELTVKAWGAGGAGGGSDTGDGGNGGGGGYATSVISVSGLETLDIEIGGGGSGGAGNGGGNGGGAGSGNAGGENGGVGGAGAGTSGTGEQGGNGSATGGSGGTQSAGGAGGSSGTGGNGTAGGFHTGGDGGNNGGGGGGSGYHGGGGASFGDSGAAGAGTTPGNNGDGDRGTAGQGGVGATTNDTVGGNGNPGRIVIVPGCNGGCSGGGGGATFDEAEDTPLTGLTKHTIKRLRIEVSNGTAASGSVLYRLEVSQANPTTCDAGGNTWTRINSSSEWNMADTTHFADADATQDVDDQDTNPGLTNANTTFVAGESKDTTDEINTGITLSTTQFTEVEYAIAATNGATGAATYCFRLTDAGTATEFSYTEAKYGKVTLGADLLFGFRKSITIDHLKFTDASCGATLSNFPVLVSLTDAELKHVDEATPGNVADLEGDDIIFRSYDAATCSPSSAPCGLDHEIEKYDPTTGQLIAWVRIPVLNTKTASSDTVIYMYYGNSDVATSSEDAAGVWDSNYMGV